MAQLEFLATTKEFANANTISMELNATRAKRVSTISPLAKVDLLHFTTKTRILKTIFF